LDLKERPVPQGRLKIGRDAILENLQPSLRDLIRKSWFSRTHSAPHQPSANQGTFPSRDDRIYDAQGTIQFSTRHDARTVALQVLGRNKMRVGILTGGGDCPGLNAVIRAAVRKGIFHHNDEFVGFIEGWRGVVENKTKPLTIDTVSGILHLGGTILRTSRTNPRKMEGGIDKCLASIKANQLDALITIGGDDTQGVANALVQKGIKVVGVPKTIDNDLSGTDACFGFDTAVSIATEAVDRLHSTAEAHNRVIVCEVMGRDAGWIAITSGIAGGADVIFVPEKPIDIDLAVKILKERHDRGKLFSIVVVAEGAKLPGTDQQATKGAKVDAFGHARLSGIAESIAELIEEKTGYETRWVNLGHTQRGGTPTAYDRMLATRYGSAAIDLVHEGKFGRLVVLRGTEITHIPLEDAIAKTRTIGDDLIALAAGLQPEF
jgi:ATP-dependent phosphofructokinase / diphosphate-dependent phosphofructokinase